MRWKLIGVGVLLCLALGLTVFCGAQIVRGFQGFQQTHQQANSGDVRTIRPWMTLRYIAHVYHVPETYLEQSLHITDPKVARVQVGNLTPSIPLPRATFCPTHAKNLTPSIPLPHGGRGRQISDLLG